MARTVSHTMSRRAVARRTVAGRAVSASRTGPWSLVAALALLACGGEGSAAGTGAGGAGGEGAAGGAGGDAPMACDMWAPRPSEPEVLIGPVGLEDRLVAMIDAATSSIELMMYQLDCPRCGDALVGAHQRGVAVRVLLDGEQAVNAAAEQDLLAAGVPVADAPGELNHAHAKVMIVDGRDAVVMSANMNGYSFSSERNYGVVDRDPQDVAQLGAIFERDWAGRGEIDVSCTRLLVSPLNSRSRLLASAEQTLDLGVMYVSDPEVAHAIEAMAGEGVTVRVLLAMPEWIESNAATAAELAAAGVQTRYLYTHELHAKLVIADGVPFVGSQNLSTNALENNREVGVIVTEPTPAATVVAQFEQDWANGVAAP